MVHVDGREQDVDAMTALMADDIVWQISVPTSEATGAPRGGSGGNRQSEHDLDRRLPGSEVLHIASNDDGVIRRWREKRITLRINAVFEVVDGKIAAWREYHDRVDLARPLGIDPNLVVEG